ncbi:hypothetical protein Lfu02_41520 [Longispora fulva]|uniref:Peptidase C14 caspase domain-containing protein n=1 Tax=Longispora fulva TaxID=619741 RepID=A0A8J7KKE8_9ACTN|nr:caspase family protein [Longispora fulva]MBG6136611.1 hypothetical protein [Longispora fulva]GIG59780.1 hypothetical protein Lfu02_41520 [Longispora fulva]
MNQRSALLIATYRYQDPELRELTAPPNDAEALAAVLRDPDIAGFDVTILINEPLHVVGEAIGDFYRERRLDDLALLYFTGHGLKDDEGRLYLAMANTRLDSLLFTGLSADLIDQAMERCPSRRKVLILDCCYSGAFPAGRPAKADRQVHTLERFRGRGRTVLTASDETRYSFEGDRRHGTAVQSVFTRHLVAGLRDGTADLDGDGDITLDELYNYVHDRVVEEMPQQRPKRQDNVEGRVVIARNVHWRLPDHVANAVGSPIATDRLAALDSLARLHRIGNDVVRGQVAAEIGRLVEDDSRMVAAAAGHLWSQLAEHGRAPDPRHTDTDAAPQSPRPEAGTAPAGSPKDPRPDGPESRHQPTTGSATAPITPDRAAVERSGPARWFRIEASPHAAGPGRPLLAAIGASVAAIGSIGYTGAAIAVHRSPDDIDTARFLIAAWALVIAGLAAALDGSVPGRSEASARQRALFLPGILGCALLSCELFVAIGVLQLPWWAVAVPGILVTVGLPLIAVVGRRTGLWPPAVAVSVGILPVLWLVEGLTNAVLAGLPECAIMTTVAISAWRSKRGD